MISIRKAMDNKGIIQGGSGGGLELMLLDKVCTLRSVYGKMPIKSPRECPWPVRILYKYSSIPFYSSLPWLSKYIYYTVYCIALACIPLRVISEYAIRIHRRSPTLNNYLLVCLIVWLIDYRYAELSFPSCRLAFWRSFIPDSSIWPRSFWIRWTTKTTERAVSIYRSRCFDSRVQFGIHSMDERRGTSYCQVK